MIKFPSKNPGVPVLVKILAILDYISALACIVLGVMTITGLFAIPILVFLTPFILAIYAVGAVFNFFMGWGLWHGKRWARVITIVLVLLAAVLSLLSAFPVITMYVTVLGVIRFVILAAVGSYLLFSTNVKEAFSRH